MSLRRLVQVAGVAFGLAVWAGPALAQNNWSTPGGSAVNGVVMMCLDAQGRGVPVDQGGACPTGGGGSSSTPFTPNGNFATLTATAATSASTALPAGAVVAFQNTSSVDVSCVLSAGAATATTNKTIVRAGSTVFLTVGANVNAACINQTGSASNVVVLAGGAGLGTNFGGSVSSGGGGGAVFGPTANGAAAANPPVLIGGTANGTATGNVGNWKVDSNGTGFIDCVSGGTLCTALANGVQTAASPVGTQLIAWGVNVAGNARQPTGVNPSGSIYAVQMDLASIAGTTAASSFFGVGATAAAPPANAVYMGANGSGATGGQMAGLKTCDQHAIYDASDNGSKEIIAAVSGRTIYICGFIMATGGTATNLKLVDGTGTDCATGTPVNLTPAYQLSTNDKIGANSAFWNGLKATGTNRAVCVNASAANAHQAEIWYTIQ